jgi:hypothetical protein
VGCPGPRLFRRLGEANAEGIQRYFEDREEDRRHTRESREEMLQLTPAALTERRKTLLSAVDLEVLTGELAGALVESLRDGLAPSEQGWWDDGVAHLSP